MEGSRKKLAVLGDLFIDVMALEVERLPQWGGDAPCNAIKQFAGGSAYYTALSIATLGHPTVLMGALGADSFGDFHRQITSESPVDTHLVLLLNDVPSAVCIVISSSLIGDRSFISSYGATSALQLKHIEPHIPEIVSTVSHLHVTGFWMLNSLKPDVPSLLKDLKAKGLTISLDTGFDPKDEWKENINEVLEHVDIFFPNETEAIAISGGKDVEEALTILAKKVPLVVITTGPEGAIASDGKQIWRHPAFDVEIKDTTGAGDSFTGGFLKKWLDGADIDAALKYGTACGSLAVMRAGNSATDMPSVEQVERFISSTPLKFHEKNMS